MSVIAFPDAGHNAVSLYLRRRRDLSDLETRCRSIFDRHGCHRYSNLALWFLLLLGQHGNMTPGRLRQHTGLTAHSPSPQLEMLQSHGLVKRHLSPVDRRVQVCSLTPKGISVYRDIAAYLAQEIANGALS